ncbi:MAG: hypothetical protein AAGD22_16525 [Verrucomicrobiota bacterium]
MRSKRRQPWSNPDAQRLASSSQRKRRSRRFGILLFLTFVVLSAVGVGLVHWQKESIASHVHTFQANRLASQARAAIEKGDVRMAIQKIFAALKKNPKDPDTLRTAISLRDNYAPAHAISLLQLLKDLDFATIDEEIVLLELLVEEEQFSEASALADSLLVVYPDHIQILTLSGSIHLSLNNRDAALAVLRKAEKLDPENAGVQINLSRAHLESPLPDVRQLAWQSLFRIARADSDGPDSLEALNMIFDNRDRLAIALDQNFVHFKTHPLRPANSDPTIELLAWEFDLVQNDNPQSKEKIARRALDAWSEAELELAELDRRREWLISNGVAATVAAFLIENPPEPVPQLIGSTLSAFVAVSDFESAESFLRRLSESGHQALATAGRATIADSRNDDPDTVETLFERSIRFASREDSPETLLRIGTAATNLQHLNVARQAFELAIVKAPFLAHRSLADIAARVGDRDALLTHLEALSDLNPENQELVLQTALLQLFLGIHLDQAEAAAARLLAARPNDDRIRLLNAFVHFVFERNDKALSIASQIDPEKLSHNLRVPLVAIFATAEDQALADKVALVIEGDTLHPEERALLTRHIKPDASEAKIPSPTAAPVSDTTNLPFFGPQRQVILTIPRGRVDTSQQSASPDSSLPPSE